MRLRDKVAIVVGAGQSPGEGMGNGRATVMRFVQEGAKVLAVDSNLASAEETIAMARQPGGAGGECVAFEADVTKEKTLAAMVEAARQRWGRIDVLHYNVGVSIAGGDAPLDQITEAAFDRIAAVNLRGAIMACKHVLPVMRALPLDRLSPLGLPDVPEPDVPEAEGRRGTNARITAAPMASAAPTQSKLESTLKSRARMEKREA